MRARLFATFSIASLALSAAMVALWVHSYRSCDLLVRQRGPLDQVTVSSEFGLLVFEHEAPQHAAIPPRWSYFDNPLPRRFGKTAGVLGFWAYNGSNRHYLLLPPTPMVGFTIPYWFVVAAIGAIPFVWMYRRRRGNNRARKGLCSTCGYDLRATPDRCPECGAATENCALLRVAISSYDSARLMVQGELPHRVWGPHTFRQ